MCFKCSDPWVDSAIRSAKIGGLPSGCGNCGECNIYLYNGGSWGGYGELSDYVYRFLTTLKNEGLAFKYIGGQFVLGRVDVPSHVYARQSIVLAPGGNIRTPVAVNLATGRFISDDGAGIQNRISRNALVGDNGSGLVGDNGSGIVSSRRGVLSVGAQRTVSLGKSSLVLS